MRRRGGVVLAVVAVTVLLGITVAEAAGRELPLLTRTSGGAYSDYMHHNSSTCEVYRDRIVMTRHIGPLTTTTTIDVLEIDVESLMSTIERASRHPLVLGDTLPADGPFTHYFASLNRRQDVTLRTLTDYRIELNPATECETLCWIIDRLCPPAVPGGGECLSPASQSDQRLPQLRVGLEGFEKR